MPEAGALPAARSVRADGLRIALREAGTGRPLVCVHGNAASSRWFAELLAAPPAGWRVLAPDLPNHGASAPLPAPITIPAYADALAALMGALGLERPVVLGHSMGGAVAQALAAARPGRLAGLVLVASPGLEPFPTPESHYPALEAMARDRALMRAALAATMPSRPAPYLDALVDDALAMAPGALAANARALEAAPPRPPAGSALPVLVLHGALDALVPEAVGRRAAAAWPGARLERLDGVGHSPPIEAPERVGALLSEFLEEVP